MTIFLFVDFILNLKVYNIMWPNTRRFAVKSILSYEQKWKGQNFSKIKVYLKTNFDINSNQ